MNRVWKGLIIKNLVGQIEHGKMSLLEEHMLDVVDVRETKGLDG